HPGNDARRSAQGNVRSRFEEIRFDVDAISLDNGRTILHHVGRASRPASRLPSRLSFVSNASPAQSPTPDPQTSPESHDSPCAPYRAHSPHKNRPPIPPSPSAPPPPAPPAPPPRPDKIPAPADPPTSH